jgi:hypothetical protein
VSVNSCPSVAQGAVALHRALLSALRCMLCGTCSSGVDHGSRVGTSHLCTTSFATATRDSLTCLASGHALWQLHSVSSLL